MNQQPRQLSSEESRHLRRQLQDVRDRINHLLDKLDCAGLPSVTDGGADSVADGSRPASAAGSAGGGQVAATTTSSNAAAGSFDPLTRQKYARDGTTTGSADTGQFPCCQHLLDIISYFCINRQRCRHSDNIVCGCLASYTYLPIALHNHKHIPNPAFDVFELKNSAPIAPALGNIYTNLVFFLWLL